MKEELLKDVYTVVKEGKSFNGWNIWDELRKYQIDLPDWKHLLNRNADEEKTDELRVFDAEEEMKKMEQQRLHLIKFVKACIATGEEAFQAGAINRDELDVFIRAVLDDWLCGLPPLEKTRGQLYASLQPAPNWNGTGHNYDWSKI